MCNVCYNIDCTGFCILTPKEERVSNNRFNKFSKKVYNVLSKKYTKQYDDEEEFWSDFRAPGDLIFYIERLTHINSKKQSFYSFGE